MALSRPALLLGVLCCAALAGCPRVTDIKGDVREIRETDAAPAGRALVLDARVDEGATLQVAEGASVTLELEEGCTRTFGPGTHVVVNDCAADHSDDDHDLDREQDESDRNDNVDSEESTADSTTQPGDATHPGILQSRPLVTTGMVLGGTIRTAVAIGELDDDNGDDPPPLSP